MPIKIDYKKCCWKDGKCTSCKCGSGKACIGCVELDEARDVARTIGKFLGPSYTVEASIGHIRDLPAKELGVDVDKNFQPKFVTVKGKQKAITELKAAAKEADQILIATDPDREGEAISWHLQELLKDADAVLLVESVAPWHPSSALPNPEAKIFVLGEDLHQVFNRSLSAPWEAKWRVQLFVGHFAEQVQQFGAGGFPFLLCHFVRDGFARGDSLRVVRIDAA